MTWHSVVVGKDDLNMLLITIRRYGGFITYSAPCSAGYSVTYVTREN